VAENVYKRLTIMNLFPFGAAIELFGFLAGLLTATGLGRNWEGLLPPPPRKTNCPWTLETSFSATGHASAAQETAYSMPPQHVEAGCVACEVRSRRGFGGLG
jgi:hypothetical protein